MPYKLTAPAANPYGPQVTFKTEGIFPPSAVYVGPNDSIVLEYQSPIEIVTVFLSVRLLTPQGEIKVEFYQVNATTVGSVPGVFIIPPCEGYILSAECQGSQYRGQVFVRCYLANGSVTGAPTISALLFQGYVSETDRLGYPVSATESSLSGRGWTRAVILAAPGANTEWVLAPPTGQNWIVRSIGTTFTASAVVGTRYLSLRLLDTLGNEYGRVRLPSTVTAGQTYICTWATSVQLHQLGGSQESNLWEDLLLNSNFQLKSDIGAPGAGDTWGAVHAAVEEYIGL
jgi:hypothetical protein